ncbi:uncharacterized protein TNCV_4118151 [Trichonephila clavipes]|nr:uncharacterized protein TNCV_4118151 [Trichonephila clavipes]
MVLIPQHWSFRGEYSQDKNEMGKLVWKLTDFIKRGGSVKIRRSSQENRMIRQRFRFKLRAHDNIYRDGIVLDESRSFFRVHTGYFSNIPKCIKAEFIASWACSQSSVVSSSQR